MKRAFIILFSLGVLLSSCGPENEIYSFQIDTYKYGYVNLNGEILVEPIYQWTLDFEGDELAPVRKDWNWGYVNRSGELVIPCQFEIAGHFDGSDLATVMIDGKWGFVSKKRRNDYSCFL